MTKYLSKIIISFVLIFIFGCGNPPSSKKQMSKEEIDHETEVMAEMLLELDKESVALLAIKYSLEEVTCRNILKDYFEQTSNVHRILKEVFFDQKTDPTPPQQPTDLAIKSLSEKYSIPKEKIASLIIDYKNLQKESENEE